MIEDRIKELENELKNSNPMKREIAKVVLKTIYFDSRWYEFSLRRKIIRLFEEEEKRYGYN